MYVSELTGAAGFGSGFLSPSAAALSSFFSSSGGASAEINETINVEGHRNSNQPFDFFSDPFLSLASADFSF